MNRKIKFRAWDKENKSIVNMDKVKIADLSKDNLQGE